MILKKWMRLRSKRMQMSKKTEAGESIEKQVNMERRHMTKRGFRIWLAIVTCEIVALVAICMSVLYV